MRSALTLCGCLLVARAGSPCTLILDDAHPRPTTSSPLRRPRGLRQSRAAAKAARRRASSPATSYSSTSNSPRSSARAFPYFRPSRCSGGAPPPRDCAQCSPTWRRRFAAAWRSRRLLPPRGPYSRASTRPRFSRASAPALWTRCWRATSPTRGAAWRFDVRFAGRSPTRSFCSRPRSAW